MMYAANFQNPQGYWTKISNVSLDTAIKFLDQEIKVHQGYLQAFVQDDDGKDVFSYRTVK